MQFLVVSSLEGISTSFAINATYVKVKSMLVLAFIPMTRFFLHEKPQILLP